MIVFVARSLRLVGSEAVLVYAEVGRRQAVVVRECHSSYVACVAVNAARCLS